MSTLIQRVPNMSTLKGPTLRARPHFEGFHIEGSKMYMSTLRDPSMSTLRDPTSRGPKCVHIEGYIPNVSILRG